MKDLIELILRRFTGYLPIFVSLVGTPKRSILKLIADPTERLNNALVFVGITIAIGFALQAPLTPTNEKFLTVAGSMLAFKILAILSFSGVILLVFRIFGGAGNYEITLSAYLYIISPLYIFLIVLRLIGLGVASTHNPEFARSWLIDNSVTEEQIQNFIDAAPLTAVASTLLSLFQYPATIIWFAICWGSFRSIHEVSFFRSTLAYILIMILWFLFFALTSFVMKGLHGGGMPAVG